MSKTDEDEMGDEQVNQLMAILEDRQYKREFLMVTSLEKYVIEQKNSCAKKMVSFCDFTFAAGIL